MTNQIQSNGLETAWTVIVKGQEAASDATIRQSCLTYLAETYREPIRTMMRAWGVRNEAQLDDAVQEYFTRFLEKNWLDQLDRDRGRFRTFLRVSIRHFLLNEKKRNSSRLKEVPLADETEETPLAKSATETPDVLFNRAWAQEIIQNGLTRLEQDCQNRNKEIHYLLFDRHVANPEAYNNPSYEESALALKLKPTDVTNHIHRAKTRFADLVRTLIRETVQTDADVEEELHDLREYLA